MNAFVEHHKDSIRFGYRCFDRILLNRLIQPFQQPERVIGFFNAYRNQYPVSRSVYTRSPTSSTIWVVNRSQKWGAPVLEAPEGRRDEFIDRYFRRAEADQVVAILKAREPARIMIAIGNKKEGRWHLQMAQALGHSIQLLRERQAMGPDVRPSLPLSSVFCTRLLKSASLVSEPLAPGGNRFSTMLECVRQVQQSGTSAATGRLVDQQRSAYLRPEMAGLLYALFP